MKLRNNVRKDITRNVNKRCPKKAVKKKEDAKTSTQLSNPLGKGSVTSTQRQWSCTDASTISPTDKEQVASEAELVNKEHVMIEGNSTVPLKLEKSPLKTSYSAVGEPSSNAPLRIDSEDLVSSVVSNTIRCVNESKETDAENGKATKVFKRSALVASTPLVRELNQLELPSNLQNTLSGSYWSDASQISKISLRDYSQYQAGDIIRSSGRKSRPVNKLQYTAEEKTPGKEGKSGLTPRTKSGITPKVNRGLCAIRKLRYAQEDAIDVKKKNTTSSRRVSTTRKTNVSRRKSLTSKDYRRGSLVRKYLSSSSTFTTKKVETKELKKSIKRPLHPDCLGARKRNINSATSEHSSFATERLLKKQTKSLSRTFTSISGKSAAKLYEQSFALQNYLPNTSTYLPNVSLSHLNKTDISLFKKRRKKLFNHCDIDKFAKSPSACRSKKALSEMKKSPGRGKKKNVSSKTSFEDIIEDTVQESTEEFSSIKVDDEISVCVKANSLNASNSKRRSREKRVMQRNASGENYLIHSREKSDYARNNVSEKSDGSFVKHAQDSRKKKCVDDISLSVLIKDRLAEDNIPLAALKSSCLEDNIPLSSLKTVLNDIHLAKQTNESKDEHNKENKEKLPSKGVLMNISTKALKRKKKLHSKSVVVFDLDASVNEERDRTYNANVTCNQSILASAITFNH